MGTVAQESLGLLTQMPRPGRHKCGRSSLDLGFVFLSFVSVSCVERVWATHSVSTEVGTGVPWVSWRDPPACHRVHDNSVTERQHRACVWCACVCSCRLVFAFDSVFELFLRKVVSNREAVSQKPLCTDCVRWGVGLLTCFLYFSIKFMCQTWTSRCQNMSLIFHIAEFSIPR